MTAKRILYAVLILSLLVAFTRRTPVVGASTEEDPSTLPSSGGETLSQSDADLPQGVSGDWWTQAQAYVQQSEYEITWQEGTSLPELPAAYQAPNRAHGLRTYFTSQGIRVIPREEENPSWQLGLSLLGFGSAQELLVAGNRIDYRRAALAEWYLNDEYGLQQGFLIPPAASTDAGSVLELEITGDLLPGLSADGLGVEFRAADGRTVLRYGDLQLSDSTGQVQPVQLELLSSGSLLRLAFPASQDALTLTARLTSMADLVNAPDGLPSTFDWSAGPANQTSATFGWFVSAAGDVNGDGYGDVIIGAPHYDGNGVDSGKVYAWYGGPDGLCDSPVPPEKTCAPEWEEVGDQGGSRFGWSVGTAGDVNGDGYGDVIIGADSYDNGLEDEGRAYVYHGGSGGLSASPAWKAEIDQLWAHFGHSVGTAGDVNGDGYGDVIVGAPYHDQVFDENRGKVWVWYGSGDGLGADGSATNADWWAEGEHGGDLFGWSVSTAGDVNGDGYSDILVGAIYYNNGQAYEGAAYIWHGGHGENDDLGEPDRIPNWRAESNKPSTDLGRSVSTAGDVDGDGYSDVIVGASHYENGLLDEGAAFVWYGSADGIGPTDDDITSAGWMVEGEQTSAVLGYSVSTAGDVNGDGFSDVIASAPWFDAGQVDEGAVFVWFGTSAGLGAANRSADWSAESNQAGANFGYSVSVAGDVNGDGYSDVLVGSPHYDQPEVDEGVCFVYHGSPGDPLLRLGWSAAPADQTSATFGWSVNTAGDVNGDGYSDVIVGAPHYDGNGVNSGKVYVWYGGEDGLGDPAIPPWEAVGEQVDCNFGWSVGTAGDVNGDGYGDVIIGARYYDGVEADEGRAYVWYGGEGGLGDPLEPDWKAESNQSWANLGHSVSTAGDVNGDGYSDVTVGGPYYDRDGVIDRGKVWVWYGSGDGLGDDGTDTNADWWADGEHSNDNFGWSVSTAGDVNGDGYSDILVGAYYYDNGQVNEGAAYIWHGGQGDDDDLGQPDRIPNWRAESNQYGTDFGRSVSTAGDVNGDGYSDVIVGASHYENGLLDEGAAFVWYGSADGIGPTNDDITSADWMVEGEQTSAVLGYSVSTAGDVNGDGFSDIIASAPWFDAGQVDEGAVFVWFGSAGGLGPQLDTLGSAGWRAESNQATEVEGNFGRSVNTAGDVNGDGYSDIIIGAPHYDQPERDEGRVYLYLGSGQGLSGLADPAFEGDQGGAQLGYSLDSAGDINGDGYADIILAAPYYDSGFAGEGRVYVFQGSATGLITGAPWIADGNQLEAFFGWSVGSAGDVNGDGYSDIIVGTPYYDLGQVNEGAAFVWTGSSQGLGPSGNPGNAVWSAEGDQLSANFGWAVGTAGDVNGDGFSEVIIGAPGYDKGQTNEGRAYLYHGSGSGLNPSPGWTTEGDQVEAGFGNAVATAGDINGDGFADVIVGADQYDNGQVNEGRAFVYYGSAGGLSSLPGWKAESNQANTRFGCAVSSAGDVNGDGYADVLIGAYRYDQHPLKVDEGAAFVWHGSESGLGADGTPGDAAWMAAGDQENAQFGYSVDLAGDVNGDGFADIIIGAPYYDKGPLNDGRAFVYHGSQAGLSATARWSGEGGDIGGAQFGYAVSAAGDVNGDGFADVIVGAPSFDHTDEVDPTVPDVGLLSLYTGNGLGSLNLRPRQLQPDGSPLAHLGISDSESEVRLSLLARSPLGRDLVRLQWQIAPLGSPFSDASVINGSTSNWTDTGINGALTSQTITGLEPGTEYHWRVRLIYHPGSRLGMPASRWIHVPWDGWQEQDFRTSGEHQEPPPPPEGPLTFLPIVSR
jgi:hypothetical protein